MDESHFGGIQGVSAGTAGKVVVLVLLTCSGRVYAKVVDNALAAALIPATQRKVAPDSMVYTDSLSSHNALEVSQFHHVRINHSVGFAHGRNHINGIDNFWNQAKRVLRKYNGIPEAHPKIGF